MHLTGLRLRQRRRRGRHDVAAGPMDGGYPLRVNPLPLRRRCDRRLEAGDGNELVEQRLAQYPRGGNRGRNRGQCTLGNPP